MPYRTKTTRAQRRRLRLASDQTSDPLSTVQVPVRTSSTPAVEPIPGPAKRDRGNPRQRAEARANHLLRDLDGPARFDTPMPEGWLEAHDQALTACRNQPVKHCPFAVLYWTSRGEAMGQVIQP